MRFALIDQVKFFEFIPFRHTPALTVLVELVKVRISPAHCHLECTMETTKLERAGNLNPAPDGRVDARERDSEFLDLRRGLWWHCVKLGLLASIARLLLRLFSACRDETLD